MADWIKIRIDLTDDPAVYKMSDFLGVDCPTVVGHLVEFWAWMDRHTPDGIGLDLSDAMIDRKVGLPNFAKALRDVEWLEGDDFALTLPLFERHNGQSAKARALEAEAKRLRRKLEKDAENSVRQVSDKTPPKSPTRKEKKRKENIPTTSAPPGDTRDRFQMHFQWQPSATFSDRCRMAGIPVDVLEQDAIDWLVCEFKSYWQTRDDLKTAGEWDHKLLGQIKNLHSKGELTKPASKGQTIRARDIMEELTDRSWAYR